MSNINTEIDEAFKEVGAKEETAKAAGRAFTELNADHEQRLRKLEIDLALLKWIGGLNMVLNVSILLKLFF